MSAKKIGFIHIIVLCIAIIINMLITICPFLNLYSNWYVTIIPVIVVAYFLQYNHEILKDAFYVLILGLVLTLYQFWFIYHRADMLSFFINSLITWTPCLIAFVCTKLLSIKIQKILLQLALIAMAITSYTTIKGVQVFSFASRELAGAADQALREQYMLMNIGGFDFIYALVICLPIVFWMISNSKGFLKFLNVFILLLFLYCIYVSEYTTALMISIISILLVLINLNRKKRLGIIWGIVIFFVLFGTGVLSNLLSMLINNIESEYVADRLLQVSLLLQGQSVEQIHTDTSSDRLILMQNAWNGFLESPIWGNNFFTWHKDILSGHSYVLDILAASGILGLCFYIKIFYSIFKKMFVNGYKSLSTNSRIVWLAFIAVTFVNPSAFTVIYLVIFTFVTFITNIEIISRK